MKLSKAVEILKLRAKGKSPDLPIDTAEAIQIGAVAIKRIIHARQWSYRSVHAPLIGETKD